MSEEKTAGSKKDTSTANRLYGVATTRLREKYRLEFEEILAEEYEKHGLERRTRRTAEQIAQEKAERKRQREEAKAAQAREKALAAARALAEAYPDLVQVAE